MYKSREMEGIHKCAFKGVLQYSPYLCTHILRMVYIETARLNLNQDSFDNTTWHCLGQGLSHEDKVFAC